MQAEVPVKRAHVEHSMTSLADLEFQRVLANLKDSKTMVLLCRYQGQDAVVVLGKKDWLEEGMPAVLAQGAPLTKVVDNAEYLEFTAPLLGDTKVSVTWPAKQFHIDKWIHAPVRFVRETAAMYAAVTRPFVDAIPAAKNDWVRNIFAGLKEADRVLFMDPHPSQGFVIVPDTKMDLSDPTSIYLQCILRDESLRSVRDLRATHLPLLARARETIVQVAREKLACKESQLRLYLHYYPTFWWLHIHVSHVEFPMMGGNTSVGKAILLEDVMQCLALSSDYYATATLVSTLKQGTPHHTAFVNAGMAPE